MSKLRCLKIVVSVQIEVCIFVSSKRSFAYASYFYIRTSNFRLRLNIFKYLEDFTGSARVFGYTVSRAF